MIVWLGRALLLLSLVLACCSQQFEVAVVDSPPFVVCNATGGNITGFAIEMWEMVIQHLNEFHGYNASSTFNVTNSNTEFRAALLTGSADVGISGFVLPSNFLSLIQTSSPYRQSYLRALQSSALGETGFRSIWGIIRNPFFLQFLLLLMIFSIVMAHIIWVIERRRNFKQFYRGYFTGVGASFYFVWVTITTLGYGDKTPKTNAGKITTFIVLCGQIILINLIAGVITSILTALALGAPSVTPENFARQKVAVIDGSYAMALVQSVDGRPILAQSVFEGVSFVKQGQAKYFIQDQVSLIKYNYTDGSIGFVETLFDLVDFTFMFNSEFDNETIHNINTAIYRVRSSASYIYLQRKYLPEIYLPQTINPILFNHYWLPVIVLACLLGLYVVVILIRWIPMVLYYLKHGRKDLDPSLPKTDQVHSNMSLHKKETRAENGDEGEGEDDDEEEDDNKEGHEQAEGDDSESESEHLDIENSAGYGTR